MVDAGDVGRRVRVRRYPIWWGVLAGSGQPWTVPCADAGCSAISWQGGSSRNVVWGGTCGGADCTTAWSPGAGGAALATSSENEIVVWGSANYDDDQIVVWGSAEAEMVVWGSAGEFEIVVWGSECSACEPVMWADNVSNTLTADTLGSPILDPADHHRRAVRRASELWAR